jgi:hypothetical protein
MMGYSHAEVDTEGVDVAVCGLGVLKGVKVSL